MAIKEEEIRGSLKIATLLCSYVMWGTIIWVVITGILFTLEPLLEIMRTGVNDPKAGWLIAIRFFIGLAIIRDIMILALPLSIHYVDRPRFNKRTSAIRTNIVAIVWVVTTILILTFWDVSPLVMETYKWLN